MYIFLHSKHSVLSDLVTPQKAHLSFWSCRSIVSPKWPPYCYLFGLWHYWHFHICYAVVFLPTVKSPALLHKLTRHTLTKYLWCRGKTWKWPNSISAINGTFIEFPSMLQCSGGYTSSCKLTSMLIDILWCSIFVKIGKEDFANSLSHYLDEQKPSYILTQNLPFTLVLYFTVLQCHWSEEWVHEKP